MPGGQQMVAFTRILHRTKPDLLMSEVSKLALHCPESLTPNVAQQIAEKGLAFLPSMITGSCLQIPTFRADPLTPSCDTWCEFPVSDRPNAVMQFLKAAGINSSMIKVGDRDVFLALHCYSGSITSMLQDFCKMTFKACRR